MPRRAVLGDENDAFAEKCVRLLSRVGPYEVTRRGGKIEFGLQYQYRQPLSLLHVTNWLNRITLPSFNPTPFATSAGIREIDKFSIDPASLPNALGVISKFQGIHRFERIARTLFYAAIAQLPAVIAQAVGPAFFSDYPGGRVLVLWADEGLHTALAALRVMGAAVDLADRSFEELERIGPFRMLTSAQNAGVFYPGKHLSIPLALFLPKLYGFVATKVTLAFLFLFDNPIPDIRSPYPRSGLEFVRSEASGLFRQDLDIAVESVTPDAIDRFTLFDQEFSQEDLRSFIRQYIRNLSSFLHFVVAPGNFVRQATNEWIGLEHIKAWLSFERIADEVLLMLTDDMPYLRKAALFRILDQFASLATADQARQPHAFRELLLPTAQGDPIAQGLSLYRGAVGTYLQKALPALREELVQVAIDSVYVPGLVNKQNRTIKLKDGTIMMAEEYAASLVRELRNTQHAYYTNNFDRILAISTGDIPETLPALGALAYLALIARPDLFIARNW